MPEAVGLEAPGGVLDILLKHVIGHGQRAREPHVPRGRADLSLRHIREHGGHQSVAQRARDLLRERLHAHVVLAHGHVRAVLLGPSDRDDDRRSPRLDPVADLRPGQLLEKHRVRRLRVRARHRHEQQAHE